MSRPAGARDKRPRRISQASLQNLRRAVAGMEHARVSLYGPAFGVRWFAGLTSLDRGRLVQQLRQQIDP